MAETLYDVNNALAVKLWRKKLWTEVLQEVVAAKFIGRTPGALIQIVDEAQKSAGDRITVGLRMQFTGDGVQGDETLEDNEEALVTHTFNVFIDQLRHAHRSKGKMSEQRVTFDLREEAKSALVDWWADRIDQSIFEQLCGNNANTNQKRTGLNATTAPDSNHHIFADPANNSADEDVQADANDVFDLTLIDTAVEKARTLSPGIRPVRVMGGEYYVLFVHPFQVTDIRTSTDAGQWLDIQKAAMQGGEVTKNPIFTGALGMYNNTIIHVDKRVTQGVHSTTAAVQTDVRRAVFCGAQSAVIAFGRDYGSPDRMKWVEELFDYGNKLGVAAGMVFGIKKSVFNSEDFGTIVISSNATAS